jgi:hypothetical protein
MTMEEINFYVLTLERKAKEEEQAMKRASRRRR